MNSKKKIQLPDYRRFPDEELAYRYAHRGEAAALYHIYDRYAHLVYGIALNQTDSVSRAKEVTHHLFLSLMDVLSHAQIISFKSWLLDYTTAFIEGKTAGLAVDELAGNMLYDNHTKRNSFEDAVHTSTCLTRKQLEHFLSRLLPAEEQAMLQMHIASCSICSKVVKGVNSHTAASQLAIEDLSHVYLKDHYNLLHPTIHLNSLAVAASAPAVKYGRSRGKQKPAFIRPSIILAAIMLGFALLWYIQFGHKTALSHGDILNGQTTAEPAVNSNRQSNSAAISPQAPATIERLRSKAK